MIDFIIAAGSKDVMISPLYFCVKGVEKHIYSDNESNEDTAKQNVELYKIGSEKSVSKAV